VSADTNKEWLSPKELGEWLGCGRTTTYELLHSPSGIPHYHVNRRILVRKQDVEAFLQRNRYPERDW
jgi:excisionase family DNA binding protein